MIEFHVETKKGILRRSLRVSEIKEVRENLDGTALLRVTDFVEKGNYVAYDTVELYDDVMKDSLLEKYGKLQKIKAEWYEYKTAPIVVVSDRADICSQG